jgi:hypothetical protein
MARLPAKRIGRPGRYDVVTEFRLHELVEARRRNRHDLHLGRNALHSQCYENAVRSDHRDYAVLLREAPIEAPGTVRLAFGVEIDQFDLLAIDAARVVHLVDVHLSGARLIARKERGRADLGQQQADFDRVLRDGRRGG